MSKRIEQLLEMAGMNAKRFCDPLNHQFLVDNEVTLDEHQHLSDLIATAILAYARSDDNERIAAGFRAEFDDPEERKTALEALAYATSRQRMRETVAAISELT